MQDDTLLDEAPAISGTRDGPDPILELESPVPDAAPEIPEVPDASPTGPLAEEPVLAERPPEARIVAALLERGKLSPADLGRARRLADDAGEPLLRMLVRLGLVSERDLAQAMGELLDLPLADPAGFPAEPVAEGVFTLRFLKDARVLPLADEEDRLRVAVADAADPFVLVAVAMAAGKPVEAAVGLPSEIEAALERLYEKKSVPPRRPRPSWETSTRRTSST